LSTFAKIFTLTHMNNRQSKRATVANFSTRRARKAPSELSTKANTQATRLSEQLKTGPDRARQNLMNQYRQQRYRELLELSKSEPWQTMTAEQRDAAADDIRATVNETRDAAIEEMWEEWRELTAIIRENEAHLPSIDDAPDIEKDESDPEFEEDDEAAAKTGVPPQRDANGTFQPDPATRSDLMDIMNRHIKVFQARADLLEKLGDSDEEPFLDPDDEGDEDIDSWSDEDIDSEDDGDMSGAE
jgi:hypothetical protein